MEGKSFSRVECGDVGIDETGDLARLGIIGDPGPATPEEVYGEPGRPATEP